MTTKIVQWATGPVGAAQLREVIRDPDLELVGVLVYSDDKVGLDAGDLVDLPPTGVTTTADRAAIMALDADLVLHAASKAHGFEQNTEDIIELLESGKDVITTTSYAHLATLDPEVDERIRAACIAGGTRFHAAGEHPGFMFERLAVSLTSLSQRVDSIVLRQYVDASHVPERRMLVDLMGMGKLPDEITLESPAFRSVATQAEQALAAGAEILGLHIEEIRGEIQTAVIDHDVVLPVATLPAGTVVGQILSWSAMRKGVVVLQCEEYWVCTPDIPQWDLRLEGHTVRITVEGAPRLELELVVDTDPVPELGGVSGGYVAVAMAGVRAIADVRAAEPGVVVPSIFGVYRWRD